MPERPAAVLRLEPHQIPALRAAFAEAAQTMSDELKLLRWEGAFSQPWFRDPVSTDVKAVYDELVMHGPDSADNHLTAYRDELLRIHETLTQMEASYRRAEDDIAAVWGPA